MNTRPMLSIPQVMARTSLSYATVYELIRKGTLLAVQLGTGRGTWRVEERDLEAFIVQRKRAAHQVTPAAAVERALDADTLLPAVENPFL